MRSDGTRGGEILEREPDRLEDRDLRGAGPAGMLAQDQLAQIGSDGAFANRALRKGNDDIARLGEGAWAGVDA